MQLPNIIHPEKTEAVGITTEREPIVSIAASNEPDLPNPIALDAEISSEQIREIVWRALDRDNSSRNLTSQVTKDSWVVIKPNIVTIPLSQDSYGGTPGKNWNLVREEDENVEHWGLVTDLRVIKALTEYLTCRIGPKRITIAEGGPWYTSGGKFKPGKFMDGWHVGWDGFDGLSYNSIVEALDGTNGITVDIVDLNEDEAVYVTDFDPCKTGIGALQDVPAGFRDGTSDTEPTKRKGIWLPKTIMDRDILITCPVLKTHGSVGTTLFMKNFVGCVHSQTYDGINHKKAIHQGNQFNLARGIVDLACAINPDYGVAEGFWATTHMHHGQNGINIHHNIIICGADVVAAEAVANQTMGYNPLDFDHLRLCNMKKLGEWRPDRITVEGPSVKSVRINYAHAANKYVARGLRKWNMTGPMKKPLDAPAKLNPKPGDVTDGNTWSLLDGDAIKDSECMCGTPSSSYSDNLLYAIPGSEKARKNSVWYLTVAINTTRKDLAGQFLVGIDNADFRTFINGTERSYVTEPLRYDPTPSRFVKFHSGDNVMVLEITKTTKKKVPVRLAVNICDLDGDRLEDITLKPVDI